MLEVTVDTQETSPPPSDLYTHFTVHEKGLSATCFIFVLSSSYLIPALTLVYYYSVFLLQPLTLTSISLTHSACTPCTEWHIVTMQ